VPEQDFMGFLHLGWDTATQEGGQEPPLASLSPAWAEAGRCGRMHGLQQHSDELLSTMAGHLAVPTHARQSRPSLV
jgi:hypothetical protein